MQPENADPLRARLQQALQDDYALVRVLGRGGMGAVYLAREIALDRLVAIKVLPPDALDDRTRRDGFQREAQLAAKLSHPNIVPLHSFGEKDGLSYYVMGYVRGETVADRLRRDGRLSPDETRQLLAQLADALEYAHRKGVIHRDIKPDNILVDDESGRPMLADFGIARATDEHSRADHFISGTLHYMSPEQAAGTSIDGRSDLYSLGVTAFVMMVERTPFEATTFTDFVRAQASGDPPHVASLAPDTPPDLASTIMRCLARSCEARWPDARALKDALGVTLDDDLERLPGELREMASACFYSVVGGWLIANAAAAVLPVRAWQPVAVPLAAMVIPISFAATAAYHHRKGFSWTEMRRVALWPPGWWPFWWPDRLRRPGDLWPRLPAAVRGLRVLYGALAGAVILALPLAVRAETRARFVGVLVAAYVAMTGLMVFTAWWAHRRGIPNNADLRSLVLRSTTDRRFWKRPQLARHLSDPAAAPKAPRTPAEIVRHLTDATRRMSGRARDEAASAVDVARLACAALDRLDADLKQAGSDETRKAISDRRDGVVEGLRTLWAEHDGLAREPGDDRLNRFAARVRTFSADVAALGAKAPADDSMTEQVTGRVAPRR